MIYRDFLVLGLHCGDFGIYCHTSPQGSVYAVMDGTFTSIHLHNFTSSCIHHVSIDVCFDVSDVSTNTF